MTLYLPVLRYPLGDRETRASLCLTTCSRGDHLGMLRQEEPAEMVDSIINTLNMELQR